MPTKIIGFGHYKQSGKSSICDVIKDYAQQKLVIVHQIRPIDPMGHVDPLIPPTVKIYSFADKLKQFCVEVLGLTHEQCYGTDEQKNSLTALKWEDVPGITNDEEFLYQNSEWFEDNPSLTYHESGQMTAREVLQVFGTGICRKMVPNCWVEATMRQIKKDAPDIALIPDMRFPNELEAIRANGGVTVKLLRRPFPDDNHPSETALDGHEFDFVFDNRDWTVEHKNEQIISSLKSAGLFTFDPKPCLLRVQLL